MKRFWNACLKASVVAMMILAFASESYAYSWQDLWLRPDQQGVRALQKNQPDVAAKRFQDPQWKAFSNYKAKDFQQALTGFSNFHSPQAYYNRGNTLAQLGQYQAAIEAYNEALMIKPNFADAKYNRDVILKYLQNNPQQQQQQQQQQQKSESQQAQNQKQNNDSSSSSKSSADNQNKNDSSNNSKSSADNQSKAENQNKADNQNKENNQAAKQPDNNTADAANNPSKSLENPAKNAGKDQQNAKVKTANQGQNSQASAQQGASQKSQQDLQRWLQQIPDDPGGLLQQKFLRDHLRNQQGQRGY